MKKVTLLITISLFSFALYACSSEKMDYENETASTKTTSESKTLTIKEAFENLYSEYEDFEWVYTTEWEKDQEIKVQGTLLEADTEDEIVYCKIALDTGETFYALIGKDRFNETPIKINEEVVLAGIAFGNNKYDDEVYEDAVYVMDFLVFKNDNERNKP